MLDLINLSATELRNYEHNRPLFWLLMAFCSVLVTYAICYIIDKKRK